MTRGLRIIIVLSVFFGYLIGIKGQEVPEFRSFISPIKHPIRLAGTFGELRSNHFHMGIDIKSSKGTSGDPVVAIGPGFISRILVSRSGFGNAIYIDHPNGYTSVYGHLKEFNKEIQAYIKDIQHKEESFEVNIELDTALFPIRQNEEIGKMGNSGSSSGPHLHLEIRDTKSEIPINPLSFGLKPIDKKAPIIGSVKFFHLDDSHREIQSTIIYPIRNAKNYRFEGDTVLIGAWRIGLGIQSIDPMNNGYNKNGLYKLSLKVDGKTSYSIQFDSISYDQWKYINAFIDHKFFKQNKRRYQRLYNLPGNKLNIIYAEQESIIKLYERVPRQIDITVEDFEGNLSSLRFWVKRDANIKPAEQKVYTYDLNYEVANLLNEGNLSVFIKENTFYEDCRIHLSYSEDFSEGYYSHVYHIGDPTIPLHQSMEVSISVKDTNVIASKEKICLINCEQQGKVKSFGGEWEGHTFKSFVDEMGSYALYKDTIAPNITLLYPKTAFASKNKVQFRIQDNLRTSGRAKGLNYRATIDDQWVLFEYDLKRNLISHTFDNPPDGKEHILKIKVWDDRQNIRTKEIKFRR